MIIDLLSLRLMNEWHPVVKVRDLGPYKAIVTFESKEDMEEALVSYKDLLLNHFAKVRKWSEEEVYQTRRVWIGCLGTPPHAWTSENTRKIG